MVDWWLTDDVREEQDALMTHTNTDTNLTPSQELALVLRMLEESLTRPELTDTKTLVGTFRDTLSDDALDLLEDDDVEDCLDEVFTTLDQAVQVVDLFRQILGDDMVDELLNSFAQGATEATNQTGPRGFTLVGF